MVKYEDFVYKLKAPGDAFYALHNASLYGCFAVGGRVTQKLSKYEVFAALQKLIYEFPELLSTVNNKTKTVSPVTKLRFAGACKIDDSNTAAFPMSDTDTFQKFLKVGFHAEELPAFQLWYFPSSQYVYFLLDHTFSDGGSGVAYIKRFAYNAIHLTSDEVKQAERAFDGNADPVVFSIEEDLEKLQRGPLPNWEVLGIEVPFVMKMVGAIMRTLLFSQTFGAAVNKFVYKTTMGPQDVNKIWVSPTHTVTPEFGNDTFKYLHKKVDPDTLAKLIKVCRSHQVRLTALFQTIYFTICYNQSPEVIKDKSLMVDIFSNLRKGHPEVGPTYQDYMSDSNPENQKSFFTGLRVCFNKYFVNPFDGFNWDYVQHCEKRLRERTDGDTFTKNTIAFVAVAKNGPNALKLVRGKPKDTFFTYSNLGMVKVDTECLEDMDFITGPGGVFGENTILSISTPQGGMNLLLMTGTDEFKDKWDKFDIEFDALVSKIAAEADNITKA